MAQEFYVRLNDEYAEALEEAAYRYNTEGHIGRVTVHCLAGPGEEFTVGLPKGYYPRQNGSGQNGYYAYETSKTVTLGDDQRGYYLQYPDDLSKRIVHRLAVALQATSQPSEAPLSQ